MLKSELAKLLVFSASIEGRETTELEVEAWWELVASLDYEVAKARAIEHYRESPRRLWPADVLRASSEEFAPGDEWMAFNR